MSESQKPTTDAYRNGWERLWGAKVVVDENVPHQEYRGRVMAEDKVQVDFIFYRDANGVVRERRRVEGNVIYDEPVLLWHGKKPWVEISLADWPWEKDEHTETGHDKS